MDVRRVPSQSFRPSPLLQTIEQICSQWAAANLLIYGKEYGKESAEFGTRAKKILEESTESVFTQEALQMVDKYTEMSLTDLKLYVDTLESLITDLQGSDTLQMIIQSCMLYTYEELRIVCMDLDPTKAWFHERTVTMPEIEIPEQFFPHLEKQLGFVYVLMKKLEGAEVASFSTHVFRILMDFILQDCETPVKRYEGKMLSRLTAVPKFALAIMNKIDIFWSDLKQKKEYRKPLMLLLNKVKLVRYLPDDNTAINDRIKKVLKGKAGPEQEALLHFMVRTCQNMKTPEDSTTKDNMTKLCQEVFKSADKVKKDRAIDKSLLAMMIRSVGLTEGKTFTSHWNKMAAHLQRFAQTQSPVEALKLTRLLGDLYCPDKFKTSDYITFCYELMFEKSKIPIVRAEFENMIDMMCQSFIDMAKKDVEPVADILVNIAQSIPSLREYPRTLRFLFGTSVMLKEMSPKFVEKFVSVVEPNLQTILNNANPVQVINDALSFLTDFWRVVRCQTVLPSLIQTLSGHSESEVVEKTALAFIHMMKTIPVKGFPVNTGFSILFNLLIKIHNKTPVPVVIRLLNILAEFLKEFVVVTRSPESGDCGDDWKALTKTIDKTLFPFLAMKQPAVQAGINKVFTVITNASEFVTLGSVIRESKSIEEALIKGKQRLPIHFVDLFESNIKVLGEMRKDEHHKEWADDFLYYMCLLAAPMKGKSAIKSLPNFVKGVITTVLEWDEEKIIEYVSKIDPGCWPALIKEYTTIHKKQEGNPASKFKSIQTAMTKNPNFGDVKDGVEFLLSEDEDAVSININTAYLKTHTEAITAMAEKAGSADIFVESVRDKIRIEEDSKELLHAKIANLFVVASAVDVNEETATNILDFVTRLIRHKPETSDLIIETLGPVVNKHITVFAEDAVKVDKEAKRVIAAVFMKIITKENTKEQLINILRFALSMLSTPKETTHCIGADLARVVLSTLGSADNLGSFAQYDPDVKDQIVRYAKTVLTADELGVEETQASSSSLMELITQSEQIASDDYSKIIPDWRKMISTHEKDLQKFIESIWDNRTLDAVLPFIMAYAFDRNPGIVAAFITKNLPFTNAKTNENIMNTVNEDNKHIYHTLAMLFAHTKDKQTAIDCFGSNIATIMLFAIASDAKYGNNAIYPPLVPVITSVLSANSDICAAVEACGDEQIDKLAMLGMTSGNIYAFPQMNHDRVVAIATMLTEKAISGDAEILISHIHSLSTPMSKLEPHELSQFVLFILSFVPRHTSFITEVATFLHLIWSNIKDRAEPIISKFTEDLEAAGGCPMVLAVVQTVLKNVTFIGQKEFTSCMQLLTTVSFLTGRKQHGVLELCTVILDSMLTVCGLKSSGFIDDLTNPYETLDYINATPAETKRPVVNFLLEFTATSAITDTFFRYTLCDLLAAIFSDYETLKGTENIVQFITAQSVTSDTARNKQYSALITAFVRQLDRGALESSWYSPIFGATELLQDENAGIELRICAQKFLPREFKSTEVPEMKAFK